MPLLVPSSPPLPFTCFVVCTESDRQSIKMTEHLFEVLEKQGCFGPKDIDYLFELFEVFEDSWALQNFHTYHQQHLQQQLAPPNSAPPSFPISESRSMHTVLSSLSSIRSASVTPGTPNTSSSSYPPPHTHSSCPSHLQSHSPVTFKPRTCTIACNSIFLNDYNMLLQKRPTYINYYNLGKVPLMLQLRTHRVNESACLMTRVACILPKRV